MNCVGFLLRPLIEYLPNKLKNNKKWPVKYEPLTGEYLLVLYSFIKINQLKYLIIP